MASRTMTLGLFTRCGPCLQGLQGRKCDVHKLQCKGIGICRACSVAACKVQCVALPVQAQAAWAFERRVRCIKGGLKAGGAFSPPLPLIGHWSSASMLLLRRGRSHVELAASSGLQCNKPLRSCQSLFNGCTGQPSKPPTPGHVHQARLQRPLAVHWLAKVLDAFSDIQLS